MQESDYSRISASGYYGRLAIKHLSLMEGALSRLRSVDNVVHLTEEELYDALPEISKNEDEARDAAVLTVVLSEMAVEAYIYDYSACFLGDSYTRDILDSLSIDKKLVLISQLVTGKPFPKDRSAFSSLKKLIKARNTLVHFKSFRLPIDDSLGQRIKNSTDSTYSNARNAIRALDELAKEIESLHPEELASFYLGIERSGPVE